MFRRRNHVKKSYLVSLVLVCLLLIFALAGCSKSDTPDDKKELPTKSAETTTQAPETTTAAAETTTQAPETTTAAPETTTQAPETTTEQTADVPEGIDTSKYKFWDTETGIKLYMDKLMLKQDAESNGLTTFYASNKYMMAALRESFEMFEGYGLDTKNTSVEDYADLVKQANEYEDDFTPDSYGNLRITYVKPVGESNYFYYSTVRKGSDAFWLVHFACLESDRAEYEPIFEMLGNTVVID